MQVQRCFEILKFLTVDITDDDAHRTYRLQVPHAGALITMRGDWLRGKVKQRLNKKHLEELGGCTEAGQKKQRLEELYQGVLQEYSYVANKLR